MALEEEEESEEELDCDVEYAEFDGRWWGCEWVLPCSPAILLVAGRCRWVPGWPHHLAAAVAHRQRARVTVLGSTLDTWSASAPGCLCRIFLLFYAKEKSDPEVVGLALWRVGLRITLNGEVCTVDTSVAFRAGGRTWNLDITFTSPLYLAVPVRCLGVLFLAQCLVQLLLDLDDVIEGGKETHRKTMEGFYDKYRCGKAVDLRSAGREGTRFAGRRVVQHPDFRITVSMDEYVNSKLRPIEVPKGYLSNTKEISDGMLTNVKGVNGGLGWLASTGRPDMAAPHSIIPSGYDRRSPQLISEVNAAVKQCHAVPITITIWPIPFAELRWTTFTDSGFDAGERQRHHKVGWCVLQTNISTKNGRRW